MSNLNKSVSNIKRIYLLLFILVFPYLTFSQTAYFIDGYHGGVYGHYPDWQTQFMVDMLEKYPDWKINLEIEPETWDSVKINDLSSYQNFKNAVNDAGTKNRIEFVNPSYGQSYLYNISGESIIRQFAYGMEKTKEHFPSATFTTYSSEEPCFTSALPQILKSFGFKYAVLKNPNTCWGGYCRARGGELINWIGPDGTSILTVPRYESEGLEPGSTWQTEAWDNSKEYINGAFKQGIKNPVGMTLQDAAWDGGPWLENTIKNYYKPTEYKTWTDYIENISVGETKESWDLTQEDMLVSIMWGSQVLQRIAQQVRASENNIVAAEKLATFASIYNQKTWPKSQLDEAWRTLMLAQHHDTWIVPYNGPPNNTWADKVRRWTDTTNSISKSVIERSIPIVNENNEDPDAISLRVYNTVGSSRTDVVAYQIPEDWKGSHVQIIDGNGRKVTAQIINPQSDLSKVLFPATVPAMGFSSYQIQKDQSKKSLQNQSGAQVIEQNNGNVVLETDLYKIILNPEKGGTIESLVAKSLDNREFVKGARERAFNELRGHFIDQGEFFSSTENSASINITENGPVRVSVEIKGTVAGHPFTQTLSLAQGRRRIDFNINIDWDGNPQIGEFSQRGVYEAEDRRKAFYNDKYKLHLIFPLNLDSQNVYKNAPFSVTKSKLDNTFFGRWDEIKHNIILNWVDVTDKENNYGLALFSDHTTSYLHGTSYPLGLTLQYSGIGLWGRDYTITGPTNVKYALIPHRGKWDEAGIWSEDSRWNEPLIATEVNSSSNQIEQTKSFIDLSNTGFELVNMLSEGNNMKVRLFNAEGDSTSKELVFGAWLDKAEVVELNGDVTKKLNVQKNKKSSTVFVEIPRFGIRTLKFTNVNTANL